MGRPSTGGAERLRGIRFGAEIDEWLRKRAFDERVSVSELVRVAVVRTYGSEPGFPAQPQGRE